MDTYDPWAILAAASVRTERITLGAVIFSLARRRPWKVVREALTVDHLSGGRLVIPVGLGTLDDAGYSRVQPEVTDRKERAERLDDLLDILELAWTGEPVTFKGKHYQLKNVVFTPRPVQRPRIPIWTVASWPRPKSMARAARWDGVLPALAADPFRPLSPADIGDITAWLRERCSDALPEVIIEGTSPGEDQDWVEERLRPLADAGATWWIESRWKGASNAADLLARIRQGPPRW